jgi:hypothetical protein
MWVSIGLNCFVCLEIMQEVSHLLVRLVGWIQFEVALLLVICTDCFQSAIVRESMSNPTIYLHIFWTDRLPIWASGFIELSHICWPNY